MIYEKISFCLRITYYQYQLVCGCDGITYDNDCIAERAGITDWTEGECKWKYIKWK